MQELLERKKGLQRKILIVDDEFIEREILCNMLDELYSVETAEDGSSALEIIKRDKFTLSLVILDLHMPKMDGYSLLKIIRADNELRRIPVIVLTSEKGAEVKSLKLGAADFITKPYEMPDVVRVRVQHAIELAEDSVIIHETERDELTGLFNKEFFFEFGKRLDKQHDNMPMDAIVLDINRFHIVNELYGRNYGDAVLKEIGARIHSIVSDMGGLACRSDSNGFCIYLPHGEALEDKLTEYAKKINDSMDDHKISIRIGVYADDGSGLDMGCRFDRARLACHKLRNSYLTGFVFYNEELHSKELHSERLISDMDKAIKEKQFKVFYQPKYNVSGDTPVLASAEALIRWFHPEFGMVSPEEFIELFEDNGLIQKLDKYVWNEAAAQIKQWKEKYGVYIPVSVNVSRVDIFNPLLIEILNDIIAQNGLEAEKLLLEITESAYTDNSSQMIDTVEQLRKQGFKIEMDDFGSGYSSLNMLKDMPVDVLKVDMKFLERSKDDHKAQMIVENIIKLSESLDISALTEGVETEGQYKMLLGMGCELFQGYYFAKPMPVEDFEKTVGQ